MQPLLFESSLFSLHTFWVFFAIAVMVFAYSITKLSIKNSLKLQFFSEHYLKLILVTIAGARLIEILLNFNNFFYEFSSTTFIRIFHIWDNQLSFWGGILTFLLLFRYLCKKHEQDFNKWMDALVPAFIIAIAVGHLGAFFAGINYGHESSLPWAVNFESPAIKYAVPIHPTQIYALLYSAAIATTLMHITKTYQAGNIATLGVGLYAFFRFLESFARGDDTLYILGIRSPQIASLIITISAGIFLYRRYNTAKS